MRGWVYRAVEGGLLHARAGLPDRWDIAIKRNWRFGLLSRRRLARAIRQDIWRDLQQVRGFVPRVLVAQNADLVQITAGGVLMAGRAAPVLENHLAGVLDNPGNKMRWLRFAGTKGD